MRIIKLAIISVIVVFLLLLGFSLLLPSHVRISRAINIAAPMGKITPYISDLRRWEQWNRMVTDTSISITGSGADHIHTNKLDITLISAKRDSVSSLWKQHNGKQFEGNFSLLPADSVTVVQWYFDFRLRWYPWEKISSIVFDEQMGPVMEKSLTGLKELVETSP